jgi:hypothetical protein
MCSGEAVSLQLSPSDQLKKPVWPKLLMYALTLRTCCLVVVETAGNVLKCGATGARLFAVLKKVFELVDDISFFFFFSLAQPRLW